MKPLPQHDWNNSQACIGAWAYQRGRRKRPGRPLGTRLHRAEPGSYQMPPPRPWYLRPRTLLIIMIILLILYLLHNNNP